MVDVDYNDFDPSGSEERKERWNSYSKKYKYSFLEKYKQSSGSIEDFDRYILDFVGSVQCRHHKGTEIITQVAAFSFQPKSKSNTENIFPTRKLVFNGWAITCIVLPHFHKFDKLQAVCTPNDAKNKNSYFFPDIEKHFTKSKYALLL